MNLKIIVPATVVVVVAGFYVATQLVQRQDASQVVERVNQNQDALVRPHAPVLGRADAAVTVVEFFDPECESCRVFHPMSKTLLKEFEGQIRMVFRYAPFHANSLQAIQILEAARKQNRYWETLEVLFEHQPEWGSHHAPRPELMWTFIKDVPGLDVEQVRTDAQDPIILERVKLDQQDGQALGVRMTPSFFVNGEPLTRFGYGPLRELVQKHVNK